MSELIGHTTMSSLPSGWELEVKHDHKDHWLVLLGPNGEGAAFHCELGMVRSKVLDEFVKAHRPDEKETP